MRIMHARFHHVVVGNAWKVSRRVMMRNMSRGRTHTQYRYLWRYQSRKAILGFSLNLPLLNLLKQNENILLWTEIKWLKVETLKSVAEYIEAIAFNVLSLKSWRYETKTMTNIVCNKLTFNWIFGVRGCICLHSLTFPCSADCAIVKRLATVGEVNHKLSIFLFSSSLALSAHLTRF